MPRSCIFKLCQIVFSFTLSFASCENHTVMVRAVPDIIGGRAIPRDAIVKRLKRADTITVMRQNFIENQIEKSNYSSSLFGKNNQICIFTISTHAEENSLWYQEENKIKASGKFSGATFRANFTTPLVLGAFRVTSFGRALNVRF